MTTCGRPLYARPEDANVRCRCGAVYPIKEKRAQMLDDARDYLATKVQILHALPELMGDAGNLSDARFRKWVERGKLEAKAVNVDGKPLYKVGDVKDLLDNGEATAAQTEESA